MELCSIHPFDEARVRDFVAGVSGSAPMAGPIVRAGAEALAQIEHGQERGVYALTWQLGRFLAADHPSFVHSGICFTTWEARIDRGVGMLLRPPARLFIDAGLDAAEARSLPIRLEMSRGTMGGAYVPARLVPELERLLDAKAERTIRRLTDAEYDAVAVFGLMLEAVSYARERDLAVFEALDVVSDEGTVPGVPDSRIILADPRRMDKALRKRLELAAKPPKKPGLIARLTGRGQQSGDRGVST